MKGLKSETESFTIILFSSWIGTPYHRKSPVLGKPAQDSCKLNEMGVFYLFFHLQEAEISPFQFPATFCDFPQSDNDEG